MWSTKPSLSWTAQCLAGVFLQICFPSGLGEGEGVEHLREWGGSCRLLKGSPPAHVAAGSAVCVRAFVMNPHPPPPHAIVCSPHYSQQWNLSPGLLPTGGPSSKIGGGGRAACGN